MMQYTVRHFESFDDHQQCENLQREVWAGDAAVPLNITVTIQRHGGLTLGAFAPDGQLLGFVLSILSPAHQAGANNHLCHHSHIAAVRPELQGLGVGEAVKKAQADAIRDGGFNLITWTYDPLEAKNARLNIGKLGCICRTFIRNCYGEMRDTLNRGLPSDRFEVEWWLDKVAQSPDVTRMANGELIIDNRRPTMTVEIPRDFQALKRADPAAAFEARMRARAQFEDAFARGYAATDFSLLPDTAYYTLTKLN
jgi:predicted GNAT superfamily acetyltransferase